MATQLQLRKGTKIQNDAFTGAEAELTYDSTSKTIRVHDGSTQGGVGFVDLVVDFQAPTAQNNYTWYRKYKSGWVEQGGYKNTGNGWTQITLPIEMSNTNYTISATSTDGTENTTTIAPKISTVNISTTYFRVTQSYNSATYYSGKLYWQVSGMAAN